MARSKLHPRSTRRIRTFAVAGLLATFGSLALAANGWQQLGPSGGALYSIAAGAASGTIYTSVLGAIARTYRTTDSGSTWAEETTATGCNRRAALTLEVRSDGDVFARCYARIVRSRDGMRNWSFYSPENIDGPVVFDPAFPKRAVIRSSYGLYYYTDNDGASWTMHPDATNAPWQAAFDPKVAGRLVGTNIETRYYSDRTEYTTKLVESHDYGRTWQDVSVIVPPAFDTGACVSGSLLFDAAGALFSNSQCGLYRSDDRGATWQSMARISGTPIWLVTADRSRAGRLVAWAAGTIYESRTAGESWQAFPPVPSPVSALAVTPAGEVWIATYDGVFVYDLATQVWSGRNHGLNALATGIVQPTLAGSLALLAYGSRADSISIDDGVSWQRLSIDGERLFGVFPNVTVPGSLLAFTIDGRLHGSTDGGRTWKLVAEDRNSSYYDETYSVLVPVGPQPGLVYALFSTCESSVFTGCFWSVQDVVKSSDGGRTWASTNSGVKGSARLVAGAADPLTLLVSSTAGLHRSRDGGGHWERLSPAIPIGNRLVADPVDPARWYAVGRFGSIAASSDYGTTWSDVSPRYMLTEYVDLIVDPANVSRLYLVRTDGGISVSDDRGAQWRTLLSPSSTLLLHAGSARLSPVSPTTIYAGAEQGALRIDVAGVQSPAPVRAIEYYRPNFDHYFITADPTEIANLDGDTSTTVPFARTGASFEVWPAGAQAGAGTSPVCRFYGKPEKFLDSHFFSASPAECQAVADRFSDSWVYESPNVFVTGLPDSATGACPPNMVPVYRLFNNRRDANHRYTTSRAIRDQMVSTGWIAEGYGPVGVAMCASGP